MSEVAAQNLDPSIPLGRRIGEIMEEKGDAFSIRAFATRIGMNRETLRNIIAGTRTILPSELETIAKGLNVSIDRLKQMDTYKMAMELESLLQSNNRTKMMLKRSSELAEKLARVAIGATERSKYLNKYGRVQYLSDLLDEAHETWLEALQYAGKVYQKHGESEILHSVTANLMLSFTRRKEFTNIDSLLHTVETVFEGDSNKLGYAHYTRMIMNEHLGDLERARTYAYLSLDQFRLTNSKNQIGRAEINVAHYEFLFRNFDCAKHHLLSAIENLIMSPEMQLIAVKEYAKVLLSLEEREGTSQIINDYLPLSEDYPSLQAKLKILYSIATNDLSFAENVSDDSKVCIEVRYLACKYLMNHFKCHRDSESLLRYHEKIDNLLKKPYEFLFEEAL